jgi:hypothetical protein
MKTLIVACVFSALLSCAHKQPPAPKVELGACAFSQVLFVFFDDAGNPVGIVPTDPGCRCSYTVDGKEMVETGTQEASKCQTSKTQPAAPEKL